MKIIMNISKIFNNSQFVSFLLGIFIVILIYYIWLERWWIYFLGGIIFILFGSWLWLSYFFNSLECKYIDKNHVAIIFAKSNFFKNLSFLLTKANKMKSILIKNEIPSVNYIVLSKEQFEKILQNKHVKAAIIFGHGSRHTLSFKEESYHYCDFRTKKHSLHYIAQLHCNDNGGESLYEVIKCNGYDTKDYTFACQINKIIKSNELIPSLKEVLRLQ